MVQNVQQHSISSKRGGFGRIPPEILGEIFVHCLPVDSTSQSVQQLLSSVCRFWRTLAFATPALWASLDITCDGPILRPPLPIIRTHLQRSRTHPLSFILRTKKHSRDNSPHVLPVLTALSAARQQWHDIRIKLIDMTQDIQDLITQGDAPLLRSVQCDAVVSWQRLPVPLSMVHCCPRLESFRWYSKESPLLLPLGITQLTSLSLRTKLDISRCITILHLSPRLSSATFHNLDSSESSIVPHLIHPALCTLTAAGKHFPTLLDALTLPALLDLDLKIVFVGWDTALYAFLARSRPTLRRLFISMHMTCMNEPALLRILSLTPHLRDLELSGASILPRPPFTAATIRALHPSPTPGAFLCPHLQRLDLSWASDCPDGLCGAMLRARWGAQARANGVACLEEGRIVLWDGMHERDRADMEELRAEGMQGELRWVEFLR